MRAIGKPHILSSNKILAALPIKSREKLSSKLRSVELELGEVIFEPGAQIEHVYFPESGIVSFQTAIEKRSRLEVGVVGNEGLVGLSAFLGVTRSPNTAVVRASGTALSMRTDDFMKACKSEGSLAALINSYAHLLLTQLSLVGACNRFHPVVKRLAFWLLMTSDRLGTGEFKVTHQFMSDMIGVRREAVAIAARGLQDDEFIAYSRGNLSILDRRGLESFSCRCYKVMKAEEQAYFLAS